MCLSRYFLATLTVFFCTTGWSQSGVVSSGKTSCSENVRMSIMIGTPFHLQVKTNEQNLEQGIQHTRKEQMMIENDWFVYPIPHIAPFIV